MKINRNHVFNFLENYTKIIIGVVVFIFVGGLTLLFNKGTFSIDDETSNSLTITCPEVASAGEEIECLIRLNSEISTQGVSAKYDVTEGLTFVSFEYADNWNSYVNDEDGFLLVNSLDEGIVGEWDVGTVKYKLPSDVSSNSIFKVGLVDAEIGDGDTLTLSFDDIYDEVRIVSDVSILDNLLINDGEVTIEPLFDSEIFEYSAKVSKNTSVVNVSASLVEGLNGNITGDVGELELQYGNNDFEIVVTAEDGISKTVYKLSIYRNYEFIAEGVEYIYDENDNYLYTANDVDRDVILSNLKELEDGISYDMSDDNTKLYIKKGDLVLEEINIVNFEMSNMIVDNYIYIGTMKADEFLSTIKVNNAEVKIMDLYDKEITSGSIGLSDCLNVYYDGKKIDNYSFSGVFSDIYDMSGDLIIYSGNFRNSTDILCANCYFKVDSEKGLLNVMRNDVILDSYNFVGIMTDYKVGNDSIYVLDDYNNNELILSNIDCIGGTCSIDSNTNKLIFKYNGETLKQYLLTDLDEYISFDEYVVDDNKKIISGIEIGLDVSSLNKKIITNLKYDVLDTNDNVVTGGIIKTGYKLKVQYAEEEIYYNLSVKGDVLGEGSYSKEGAIKIAEHIIDGNVLQNEYLLAADINGDNVVKMNDVMLMMKELNS